MFSVVDRQVRGSKVAPRALTAWCQYRSHELTGVEIAVEVADRQQRHRPAGPGRGASDMREKHHVVEVTQFGRHLRLIGEGVR